MRVFLTFIIGGVVLAVPALLFAEDLKYVPLVGVPGVDPEAEIGVYIQALYTLAIGLAVLVAVVKLILAGVQYMLTDIVTSKESAKRDIRGALLGLIIILGAVLLLETINPGLKEMNILRNAKAIKIESPSLAPEAKTLWTQQVSDSSYSIVDGQLSTFAHQCKEEGGTSSQDFAQDKTTKVYSGTVTCKANTQ